jgi:glycosyltransferase involved in cell wall biosynthesis
LLAGHDAGLFTSRVEGWGLTLQEMFESGMPVYATNAGAVADLRAEFPDLLREFPPGFGERIDIPSPSPVSQSYLSQYSWTAIAADYLEKIHEKA